MVKLRKYFRLLLVGGATILNLLFIFLFDYQCPWKENFDIDCAGCGVTRMLISILRLEFYQAFRYNPLFFSLLVLFFIYGIYVLICKLLKISFYRLNSNYLLVLLFLVVSFGIIRNIKYFSFLKPTIVS